MYLQKVVDDMMAEKNKQIERMERHLLRMSVLATKHCPQDHRDFQEIKAIIQEMDAENDKWEGLKELAEKNYCADYQAGNPCEACTMQAALIQAAEEKIASAEKELMQFRMKVARRNGFDCK